VDNLEPQFLVLLPIRTCGPLANQLSRIRANSELLLISQIVLCIASGGKAICTKILFFIKLMIGLALYSHRLHRPRQPGQPHAGGHRLPLARPQLASRDVGPLRGDAVRRDAADRLPDLEVYPVEQLQGPPRVTSRRPMDPRRVWCALQRHDHLPARIFVDKHRRDIRRVARPDQRACPVILICFSLSDFFVVVGARSDVDYCARWTEKLRISVLIYAGKRFYQQSVLLGSANAANHSRYRVCIKRRRPRGRAHKAGDRDTS
jgi:hypothetical protein